MKFKSGNTNLLHHHLLHPLLDVVLQKLVLVKKSVEFGLQPLLALLGLLVLTISPASQGQPLSQGKTFGLLRKSKTLA